MNKYEAPTVQIINFSQNDEFLTSSSDSPAGKQHGNAWGYNNGNHNGHGKGHNPHDLP